MQDDPDLSEDDYFLNVFDDLLWRDNKVLLKMLVFSSLHELHLYQEQTFGDAPVTLLSMPQVERSGNGGNIRPSGVFAVSVDPLYKEQIWDLIKFCLREENQSLMDTSTFQQFPVNRNAMQAAFAKDCEKKDELLHFYYINDEEFTAADPTPEEAQRTMDYIGGITTAVFYNTFLVNIVQEEAGKYFAGDCTEQDAASAIQSRISLYLSEHM